MDLNPYDRNAVARRQGPPPVGLKSKTHILSMRMFLARPHIEKVEASEYGSIPGMLISAG